MPAPHLGAETELGLAGRELHPVFFPPVTQPPAGWGSGWASGRQACEQIPFGLSALPGQQSKGLRCPAALPLRAWPAGGVL